MKGDREGEDSARRSAEIGSFYAGPPRLSPPRRPVEQGKPVKSADAPAECNIREKSIPFLSIASGWTMVDSRDRGGEKGRRK